MFNEVICTACSINTPTWTKFICSYYRSFRLIKRRDLSNERNTFKSKTIFYHKKTRLKPERAPEKKKASVRDSYKADPEKKKASVCDSYKVDPENKKASLRDSYKADRHPEKKASVRDSYNADIESKQSAKRQRYQEDLEENRSAKRQRYQEDVEENRAAKRQKYEDNSAAIKASERNRYWNDPAVRLAKRAAERKRYRRGHRTTTTTQRYVMACCIALALKSYRKMCMQHVYSTHVTDLPFTSHVKHANCCVQSFVTCLLNIGVSSLI